MKLNVQKDLPGKLKKILRRGTYRHSLGVAGTALALAGKFGADKGKAFTAGLLHDCAKDLGKARMKSLIKKYGIKLDPAAEKIPAVWHSFIGARLAKEQFGVKDRETLAAIESHTTGVPKMGRLAGIIYAADYIEPGRKYASNRKLRKIAGNGKITLKQLISMVAKEKTSYLRRTGKIIHPGTIKLLRKIK
jgi:predicted HD superfamily hydrolase involved in NAD metabolism